MELLSSLAPSERDLSSFSVDMSRTASIILGGGQGKRLFPLTQVCCKPAIPIAGRYKIIDISISNAINSGCSNIFIITQFLSSSLHSHLFKSYRSSIFKNVSLQLLAAEQKPTKSAWFEGTADAVRQNIEYLLDLPVDYFLILSGDQLYSMDYKEMMRVAKQTDADVVIAALPIEEHDCHRMGLLQVNDSNMITDFIEKPSDAELLLRMRMSAASKKRISGIKNSCHHLASMGIYLFKRDVLLNILNEDCREDFGKHLLPTLIERGNSAAYLFDGYWEDIGTIEAFYRTNMALTTQNPRFNFYEEINPVFAERHNLPGPKIENTLIKNSIICEGCVINAKKVSGSILGPRTVVKQGSIISDSYVMGNDFYKSPITTNRLPMALTIGENSIIAKSIIDRNVCIGNNVRLTNEQELVNYDSKGVHIRDGIIIVSKGTTIPDDFIL